MFVSQNGSLIRVAVYGRGIWEIYPRSEGIATLGRGDFDANGVIDFLDVSNLTTRLTLTPVAIEVPIYDSEMNVTEAGFPGTLDENDLAALFAKFGGAP
jgi:hypothetical protein